MLVQVNGHFLLMVSCGIVFKINNGRKSLFMVNATKHL